MHSHETEKGKGKEAESVRGDGGSEKLREREKNGSVEVIYGSCIIFYNTAPPPPLLRLSLPPPYPTLPLGCAPPHCHTKERSLATPASD